MSVSLCTEIAHVSISMYGDSPCQYFYVRRESLSVFLCTEIADVSISMYGDSPCQYFYVRR